MEAEHMEADCAMDCAMEVDDAPGATSCTKLTRDEPRKKTKKQMKQIKHEGTYPSNLRTSVFEFFVCLRFA